MAILKRFLSFFLLSVFFLGLLGCGDTTRNDQGVSFQFSGWFSQDGDDYQPVGGSYYSLSAGTVSEPVASGGELLLWAGLHNYLSEQFIRATRVNIRYYIPGAEIQPPSTSFTTSAFLSPRPSTEEKVDSSLPDGYDDGTQSEGMGQSVYTPVALITPDIAAWMSFHRDYFPEAPFSLIVTAYAEGTTSAGHYIESNEIDFEIIVLTDNSIAPTTGSSGSSFETGDKETEEAAVDSSAE